MKVFLVAYLMGKMAVVAGPLEASGDLQANLDWCNKYVREEVQPQYEKNLQGPERLAKLREINPDFTKDSLKYGCELHQERPKLTDPVPLL